MEVLLVVSAMILVFAVPYCVSLKKEYKKVLVELKGYEDEANWEIKFNIAFDLSQGNFKNAWGEALACYHSEQKAKMIIREIFNENTNNPELQKQEDGWVKFSQGGIYKRCLEEAEKRRMICA